MTILMIVHEIIVHEIFFIGTMQFLCADTCTFSVPIFGTEFILISLISLSVTSTKRLAAILKISVLEYNSLIRQI